MAVSFRRGSTGFEGVGSGGREEKEDDGKIKRVPSLSDLQP